MCHTPVSSAGHETGDCSTGLSVELDSPPAAGGQPCQEKLKLHEVRILMKKNLIDQLNLETNNKSVVLEQI